MLILPLLLGGITFAILLGGGSHFGEAHIADAGIVQNTTLAILLFAAASAMFLTCKHGENRLNFALLACGLAIYAGREHDLHRLEFLAEHYTRLKFYTMAAVPLWQKCCFGALMAFIIGTIVLFVVRMVPQGIDDLKRAEPWSKFTVAWLVVLAASQISDRTWLNETYFGRAFEETAELAASGFAVLVVWYFPRKPAELHPPNEAVPTEIPCKAAPANAS